MLQNHTKEHGHLAEITMDMSGKLQLGQSAAEIARTTSEDVFSEEELETLVTANQLDYEAQHRHRPPVPPPPPPVTLACCVYLAALLLCQAARGGAHRGIASGGCHFSTGTAREAC